MELYIERWLKAPAQDEEGRLLKRERGTPQGGVITPLTQKVIWVAGRSANRRLAVGLKESGCCGES